MTTLKGHGKFRFDRFEPPGMNSTHLDAKIKNGNSFIFYVFKTLLLLFIKKEFSNISKRIKLKCCCFYLFKRSKYFRSSWTGVIGCRESPRMMTVNIIVIRLKSKTCLIILQIIAPIKILENRH